jgi:hypothetical protein
MTDQPAKTPAREPGASNSHPTSPDAGEVCSSEGFPSCFDLYITYDSVDSGSDTTLERAEDVSLQHIAAFEWTYDFLPRTPHERKRDDALVADSNLRYNRTRYYEPSLGRWVTEEPPPNPPGPAAP